MSSTEYVYLKTEGQLTAYLRNIEDLMQNMGAGNLVLGLDAEWPQNRQKNGTVQATICQISLHFQPTGGALFAQTMIVDLLLLSSETVMPLFETLFRSEKVLKLGFDIEGDLRAMRHVCGRNTPIIVDPVIDMQLLASGALGKTRPSLKAVVKAVLDVELCKEMQQSAWGQRPLSEYQLQYAGRDAEILIDLYLELAKSPQSKLPPLDMWPLYFGLSPQPLGDDNETSVSTSRTSEDVMGNFASEGSRMAQGRLSSCPSHSVATKRYEGEARFVCDASVEGLAKALRQRGVDCAIWTAPSGCGKGAGWQFLVESARQEGRIILSSDRRLGDYGAFVVSAQGKQRQMDQIIAAFDIAPPPGRPVRCVRCNAALEELTRDEAEEKVPSQVLRWDDGRRYWLCPGDGCAQLYWKKYSKGLYAKAGVRSRTGLSNRYTPGSR